MPEKPAENDDPGMIEVEQLARFADCLSALGETYGGLAKWLKGRGITEIPADGMPTAQRGAHYLANFTSNVLAGFNEARMQGRIGESPDKIVAKALAGEALARNLSGKQKRRRGRPPGTNGGTGKEQ